MAEEEPGAPGTPGYKAPELIMSEFYELGPALDIWSLGCLVCSCYTNGEPTFGNSCKSEQMVAHMIEVSIIVKLLLQAVFLNQISIMCFFV